MKALPTDSAERKKFPIGTVLRDYFPDAIAIVARIAYEGNCKHHPGTPLHWDKSKSTDEIDCLLRHLIEGDLGNMAWRALAHLQREYEEGRFVPGWEKPSEFANQEQNEIPENKDLPKPMSFPDWCVNSGIRYWPTTDEFQRKSTGKVYTWTKMQELYSQYLVSFNRQNGIGDSNGS